LKDGCFFVHKIWAGANIKPQKKNKYMTKLLQKNDVLHIKSGRQNGKKLLPAIAHSKKVGYNGGDDLKKAVWW